MGFANFQKAKLEGVQKLKSQHSQQASEKALSVSHHSQSQKALAAADAKSDSLEKTREVKRDRIGSPVVLINLDENDL